MTERWKWPTVQKVKAAAEELKAIVRAEYPDAQFTLARAPDDQHIWFLWTEIDIEDPDEARYLTLDREAEMLVDDNILLHMLPVRSLKQVFGYEPRKVRKTG